MAPILVKVYDIIPKLVQFRKIMPVFKDLKKVFDRRVQSRPVTPTRRHTDGLGTE